MRRAAQTVALLIAIALAACATPSRAPASAPAPKAAPPAAVAAGTATPSTWQDTILPASARPGASSDDSSDNREGGEKSSSRTLLGAALATPRVVPTPSTPMLPPGIIQEVFVNGLALPVAFEFAPDGHQLFVNELYGKVRLVVDGELQPDPVVVLPTTQGLEQGALGLALDPNFARNRWFYVLYSQAYEGRNDPRRNRIVRFTEQDGKGTEETIIFDNLPIGKPGPENLNGDHNGGRIGFGPDGKLYVTVGDTARRSEAKKAKSVLGKVLRLNADGSIPADNPDPEEPVFASGVRSPFGLDFQPGTGLPWVTDNGPQGDDEINRIVMGGNYGWPNAAGKVGKGDGSWIDPVWDSGAERYGPTGMTFYTGNSVPEWRNDLFFCDWNTGSLWRLNLQPPDYDTAGKKEVVAQPCRALRAQRPRRRPLLLRPPRDLPARAAPLVTRARPVAPVIGERPLTARTPGPVTEPARGRALRLLHGAAVACTILAGLVLSAQFVLAGARSVSLAWPITHPEGATIAAMLRVRDGEALYQDFQQFPYLITPYPPLQPVTVGLISRLLGLSVLETAGLARTPDAGREPGDGAADLAHGPATWCGEARGPGRRLHGAAAAVPGRVGLRGSA